jgi:hypothetical protein|tara:strand:+ start:479 stop:1597 length:1119 start_codon:yes stop_codon:yes gene_type:complete
MKILLLAGGARAGVDLFQSLLDGHEQILQFPGVIYINSELEKILSKKSKKEMAQTFIKQYPVFFDSRIKSRERHHMLGEKKNSFYKVNKKKFIQRFISFSKNEILYAKDKKFQNLYLLHKAYDFNYEKKEKKILIINAHIIPFVVNFKKLFKNIDYEIIHTIRHPLSSISSTVKNWLKYKNGINLNPKELFYNLDLIFFGFQKLKKLNKKLHVIQLEKLHQNVNSVMRYFCQIYNLKFSSSLKESTYHKLKWWGDIISGKDLNGVNKNFKISYDSSLFENKDLFYIKNLMNNKLKKYNYKIEISKKYFIHFMPLKCELIVWKNTIKNKKIKHILSIPYFYLKRILIFNKIFIKDIVLPKSILLNKKTISFRK